MKDTKIRATAAPWHQGIEIMVHQGGSYATSMVMEEIPDHAAIIEPTLRLSMTAAQELMDDLWASGLRPTEGAGSAGSLRATEKHLADMRTIAFSQLGIEPGGKL
jgi:hypothetical protein